MIHQRKILKAIAYAILLCFTSLTGAQPLYAIPANTQLPTGPDGRVGIPHDVLENVTTGRNGNTLTITQDGKTSVLEWGNFSIGADAAVEFKSTVDGFNSLNYVTGANAPISEIYGQLTALGGNIFIANPAGVQIGNSAQINVGSLYVTNKDVGKALDGINQNSDANDIVIAINKGVAETNAELMSLGAIVNAKNVTFDGGRIVPDTDRIYAEQNGEMQKVENTSEILNIRTTDTNNVVLGYDAYQEGTGYSNAETKKFSVTNKEGKSESVDGYMWVHNLAELQAMDTNRSGNYALRNSIDANATAGKNFNPIGDSSKRFSGRFDGLGYSIFGLNVKEDTDAAGLFGVTNGAHIKNFTLNGGSISGGKYVGAAVGSASNNSIIENITNTASVSGTGGEGENGVGGVVGYAGNTKMSDLINIGTITGEANSINVGGIVGYMMGGSLTGESYNLGGVTGGHNIGGIVGQATSGARIGSESFQIFNQLNVTGDYNVGGIAGMLSGGTITNAANHGNILAKGYTIETYEYNTVERTGSRETITAHRDNVNVANAGGIVGISNSSSKIRDVMNSGNVTSDKADGDDFYKAGNVGGIVGRAQDTNITNAENKENTVAGAHNVGGVAGFLGGMSTIDTGLNNGGDITGTGARTDSDYIDNYFNNGNPTSQTYDDGFVRERVRPYGQWGENEIFIVGNIGGIAGYIYGDGAQITNSGNRGTVHSEFIEPNTPADMVPQSAKAANVGGVAGKISQLTQDPIDTIKGSPDSATVYNSYNTGDVQGYTGVGGVVGSMYNGSIAGSYNLGTLRSTRQALTGSLEPLNMGGVVGDTTENTGGSAVIYDVYNAGTIGDAGYEYYGRHVGGVVGRLSGTLEKSYNTGDVYNGYSTVGGVAGWWYSGDITNVFNTGNVTVRVDSTEDNARTSGSQVGGIVGASSGNGGDKSLTNAYNLGTIRSFAVTNPNYDTTLNSIGGIIGNVQGAGVTSIKNVYTTNNLYAATATGTTEAASYTKHNNGLGAVYGRGNPKTIENAYYVKMYGNNSGFVEPGAYDNVTTLTPSADDHLTEGDFDGFTFVHQNGADIDTGEQNFEDSWRIYDGTMPILNAFLPDAEKYFGNLNENQLSELGIADDGIQYGTAANPLLTIINANEKGNVTLDWEELGSSGNASLAVYGGGLTLDKFDTGTGYYRGTLYADGALKVDGTEGEPFNLGSSANLYGTNVEIDANGDATIYGNVTSTNGGISIKGDDVEIIGKLAASKAGDEAVSVKNIAKQMPSMTGPVAGLDNPKAAVPTVSDAYAHKANDGNDATETGSITVNASGAAEVLYGNLSTGQVLSGGSFSVSGSESVYVDSDLHIGKDLTLNSDGEIVLDLSNMGIISKENLHQNFLDHFKKDGDVKVTGGGADGFILALDMWDAQLGRFKFDKYDTEHTLTSDLESLNILINGTKAESAKDYTHVWVNNANQLKGIQEYAADNSEALTYNFALKDNIDATELENYEAIGGDDGFSGTFDGRDFRIIGLNTNASSEQDASSGIFGTLAGTVKDLRVYASKFFGGDGESAGAIASEVTEGGKITGVTTFGNTVTAEKGAAGGIAGKNSGSILESTASDSVTASGANAYAGGVAGVNTGSIGEKGGDGESAQITADSAVRSGTDGAAAIGGVVGKNENGGKVWLANSLGVTTGANAGSTGGIAGTNSSEMTSLYNESIVTGGSNVGGVAGDNSGTMENAVNATGITATDKNAGGLAGVNSGKIDSGRNAGVVTGGQNVGGLVGANKKENDEKPGILKNLSNALAAVINGKKFVGGIAGSNSGTITGESNLINEGAITGVQFVGGIAGQNSGEIRGGNAEDQRLTNKASINGTQYVGGIAGQNTGTIENTNAESKINAVDGKLDHESENLEKQFFGGVTGENIGIIDNATNTANLRIEGGKFVGGITGRNSKIIGDDGEITTEGVFKGKLVNKGAVYGDANVGGIAGMNQADNVLVGTKEEKLIVSNENTVEAENGGAAGIFHTNSGRIEYAEISNSGKIIGNESDGSGGENTGALFGVNTGSITNSTLKNSGEVTGGKNTGGLIGTNTGNITYSSLINEVGAKVTGTENVGGLIGYNTGAIKGGRIDDSGKDLGLYTYKIYNNGTVSGSANVGGLIGNNAVEGDKTGSLTAGYNTGVVSVTENSEGKNVGGIVGVNAGTIDQVFNTIMTGVDNLGATLFGAVTGENNVGGIIGSNTGKLTNAYNTTGVTGTTNIGNIVGKNTDTVENVYATNETGTLVGDGNAKGSYSFSEADNEKEGITVIEPAAKNKQGSYEQFDFTGDSGTPAVWKIYEGKNGQEASGTPLLKVFLTNAEYSGETSFTYNGNNQGLSLDGVTVDGEKLSDVAKTLLSALEGKNAYNGYLGFTSEQIAGSTTKDGDGSVVFNPNNLGYDIDAAFDISKAQLSVALDEISREYGNGQIKNDNATTADGHYYNNGYGYTVTADNLTQEMIDELGGEGFYTFVRDGAVDGVSGQKKTNDVDSYTWSAAFKLGELAQNYEFADSGNNTLTVDNGVSKVTPATLTIQLDNVNRTYGDISKPQYSIKDDGNLVNGDAGKLFFNAEAYEAVPGDNETYGDGALYTVNGDTRTKDVGGTYYWNVAEQDYAKVFGGINTNNYNITVIKGESNVTPKELSISSVLATIMYGNQNNEGFKVNVGNLVGFAEGYGDEEQVKLDSAYFNNTSKGTFSTEYINSQSNRVTADAGTYENGITYSGLSTLGLLTGGKAKNYVLADSVTGNVEVMKANLNITFNDIWREYGDTAIRDNGSYGYTQTGLVNMDDANIMFNADAASGADGGIIEVDGKQRTNDAGTYNYVNVNDENSVKGLFNNVNFNNYTLKEVSGGNSKVTPKTLSVSDILATIVYGNQNGKGFSVDVGELTGFAEGYGDEDFVDLNRSYFGDTANGTFSEAYTHNQNGRITADAGTYENGITYSGLSGLGLLTGGKAKNYVLADNATGNVEVMKADLIVTPNAVSRGYGDLKADYTFSATSLVNDDENYTLTLDETMISDMALVDNKTKTDNVGGYKWTFVKEALGGVENLLRNYDVTVGEADSTVIKADLTIKADDQNMLIGTTPNFTGTTLTELANQLVNGDSLPDGFSYLFGVGDEAIFSEVGTHADAIGLFYNGAFYGGGLTGWGGVFANYDVNFVPGTLTVVPPSTDNYGHLHSDGWDRVRNFRERKAEVFFHEGGMEYDEDM